MSDNQFLKCPARMEYGSLQYSTYSSSQTLLDSIKRANGIDLCTFDNNDMRAFLQHNATKLIESDRRYMMQNTCNLPKRKIVIMPPYAQ